MKRNTILIICGILAAVLLNTDSMEIIIPILIIIIAGLFLYLFISIQIQYKQLISLEHNSQAGVMFAARCLNEDEFRIFLTPGQKKHLDELLRKK